MMPPREAANNYLSSAHEERSMTYKYELKGWQMKFVGDVAREADVPMSRVIEYVFQKASSDVDDNPRDFYKGLESYLDSLRKG